ncbi:subtilisin family serine protease [Streptomyces luteogriseus]|uniref:S8 family peptidase n=1 Tax=Streptomyces luteogriseus TaxID=68233 RepID=UPI00277E7E69|nr:S8 family peptidase [Streptomyces luteogriseus]MDQ0713499.1 subtilisin family serine protease [Streptomyces luteogriseus]
MREIFTARRRIVAAIAAVAAAAAIGSGTALPAEATPSAGRILQENSANAVENSYIVVLKESAGFRANSTKGEDLVAKYGATVDWSYDAVLNGYAISISASGARSLAEDPAVEYVEQDQRVHLDATQFNPPWGLDRIDQPRLPRDLTYSYPDTAGKSATVYVIDTGVRITHTEFAGRARHGYDFVDRDTNASDGNGHGTHVATTVAGKTYGVAKQSKIVSVRVLNNSGAGTLSGVIAGVDWVTVRRVRPAVANMSLGASVSTSLDTAVRNSIASGVTYAVAAGNSNANAASFSPARVGSALTVGASTMTDSRASFSNYGSLLDMFAPGSLVTAGWHTSDTATATLSGTSMATPHVAGAAAIYLTSHPSAGPATVNSALVNGATPGVLNNIGSGSPNRLLRVVP